LDDDLDLPDLLASGEVPWGHGKFPWILLLLAVLITVFTGTNAWLAKHQPDRAG
jgi:hypothetical protein